MSSQTKYSIRNLKRDFPTDEACLEVIFDALHSRSCSCGGTYRKVMGRKQYQCSKCRFQIAPTAGTIFHKSDTPLTLWFHAILVFSNAKSGISAKQMERDLGVTYKCAWRILSLIRESLEQDDEQLSGDVETDAGFLGGRGYAGKNAENMENAMKNKTIVMVATERGGKMKASIVQKITAENTHAFVRANVESGSNLYTDGSNTYVGLKSEYAHSSVNHKREYARGNVHVNRVENFFSHVKRSMRGTYKSISKKHLQSYVDAFVWHYNNRHNDKERFGVLIGALLHA